MEKWQSIIEDHGFTVVPQANGSCRVVGSSWQPETGAHFDEILIPFANGSYRGVEVLTGTDTVHNEFRYENLRHFLGY